MKNCLIIIRGPLGVGKTTIARILAERIGAKCFSIDEILKEERLDRIDPKEHCIPSINFLSVEEEYLPEIQKHLEKQSVIFEGNFYHKEQIDFFAKHFKHNLIVVTLTAKLETCIYRDKQRGKSSSKTAIEEIYKLVSRFDAGIIISSDGKPRDLIVEQIQNAIKATSKGSH